MKEDEARLAVRIQPCATSNEVAGMSQETLRLKIAAPPQKGRANRELVAFLSQRLGLKRNSVEILSGHTARNKVIRIRGLSKEEVLKRLLPQQGAMNRLL
ncbi:MAG: DUF167 domain-containing protein [Dehalococcoidales bacterium]